MHGFSDMEDGNMSFNWGEENSVIKNRENFLAGLGIDTSDCVITRARMSHNTDIETIDSSIKGRGTKFSASDAADVDAMITGEKNLFLVILTGDCIPLILYDPIKSVLALAHLSRINTPQNFTRKIIEKMESEYGAKPANILAGIGPFINKESYIFSAEELMKIVPDEKIFGGFISDLSDGTKSIDLVGYNIREIISAGIKKENIEISGIDTAKDKNFFSHCRSVRTGEPEGRMATVAGIKS
ncbi:MAG TPA: laccase domain-containing protein [Candidatus Paceibacterota bacterium]|nr:laccase domain-containing protein [Candidatus Paceibacterota bacterium]